MLQVDIAGDGPTLVWGHGLMSSMAQERAHGWFHRVGLPLRLLRYDACGHGQSARPLDAARYTWPALATDMLAVACQHAGERYALGGHSLGCASALLAALRAPQQVSKLVLATPPAVWQQRAAQQQRYQQMIRVLQKRGLGALVQTSRRNPALPGWLLHTQPAAAMPQLEALRDFSSELLIAILQGAMASDLPPPKELAGLKQPALILAWQDDPIHPLASAEQLADCLPHAELRVINSVRELSHWPQQIAEFIHQ
ncbi:alpha/beta fold hydrolase [Halopseudomonas sp.]|uniref:alpha/beta fold hydrolase n=1 Tax=Halopseudomonas sp. TaxID=2901191 RepID=UPI00300196CE